MVVAVGSAVDGLPRWFRAGGRRRVVLLVAIHAAAVARSCGFWGTESEPWSDRLDDLRAFPRFRTS